MRIGDYIKRSREDGETLHWMDEDDSRPYLGVLHTRRTHCGQEWLLKRRPISILLRYSDKLFGVSTVHEHETIADTRGYAWLGKVGRGISRLAADHIRAQLARGIGSTLYLWTHCTITHEARILDVRDAGKSGVCAAPNPSHVPHYYRDRRCSVWFKVDRIEPSAPKTLQRLRLANAPGFAPNLRTMRGFVYVLATRTRRK